MKLITAQQLVAVCTTAGGMERVPAYLGPLNKWMAQFEIDTVNRACAFLAQAMVETAELNSKRENLDYTHAERLVQVFEHEFQTLEIAQQYVGKPQAIANRAYAGRNGNGNEASGDGWRFRGGGWFELTGRANYARAGRELGLPLEDHPELIEQADAAVGTAALYWHDYSLNALADAGNLEAIRRHINGPACLGLDKTLVYFGRAQRAGIGA